MKKSTGFITGILAVLLAFSILGCGDLGGDGTIGSGGDSFISGDVGGDGAPGDPINVDTSVNMSASALPKFNGEVVKDLYEVFDLLDDAMEIILYALEENGILDELGGGGGGGSIPNGKYNLNDGFMKLIMKMVPDFSGLSSGSRAAISSSSVTNIEDIEIFEGAVVRGFMKLNYAGKIAGSLDDYMPAKGDYITAAGSTEFVIDFRDAQEDHIMLSGKIGLDAKTDFNVAVKDFDFDREILDVSISGNAKGANNYAVSVSNGEIGMKVILSISIERSGLNISLNESMMYDESFDDLFNILDSITFKVSLEIFDNNNNRQDALCLYFNSIDEFIDFMEIDDDDDDD
jgi:hypothetical protein